jgi:hypothetical protein
MRDCEILENIVRSCSEPTQCFYCRFFVDKENAGGFTPFQMHRAEQKSFCYFELKPEYWDAEIIKELLNRENCIDKKEKKLITISGKNQASGNP